MTTPLTVLVVEDDANYAYEIREELARQSGELATFHFASTLKEAIKKVDRLKPDLLLLDVIFPVGADDAAADRLDHEAGVKLLEYVASSSAGSRTIVLSSQSKTFAVNLLIRYKEVSDYIFKDAPWPEIRAKVFRQLESLGRLKELSLKLLSRHELIGQSAAMKAVRKLIDRVASRDSTTVLIQGESGTGKELVAQSIHRLSPRSGCPFVVVNCGAIPEGLLESEFFGHARGAFTGAVREVRGKFELAHGGTLFLDEIGEIPLALQPKLLRALQEREFSRVGDERVVKVDVRVIAATNCDLAREVKEGRFREDLFYRLNVFPIEVAPLRSRREDVPELVEYFAGHFNREMEETKAVTAQAVEALAAYEWPGNVRELKNIVERLFIVTEGGQVGAIDVEALLGTRGEGYQVGFPPGETSYKTAKAEVVRMFHRKFLLHHLRRNGFNVSRTAAAIGYNRQDLGKLVAELGLDREE
ncbi:MAG: sigma-54-dependent Fis family transcriptional regulator [Candidatus Wallbacteria bacterium]|nr:sigma-54-dependent Fis family transcriptional regulator [Candidatus Wallbacteria bacterium]